MFVYLKQAVPLNCSSYIKILKLKMLAEKVHNFYVSYGTSLAELTIVVHTLRVAENEILKLDFPAKRH
jgi:hypothetical protein